MAIQEINTYPFKLEVFGDGSKSAILETDYFLDYGKRMKDDGTFELFAKVYSRYYPHNVIANGDKSDLKIYKIGEDPTAEWTLADKDNKKIYLFLSNSTTYVHTDKKLPEEQESGFDSSDVNLDVGEIKNNDNLFDIVSESGAIFDKNRSYRQYAIVRSAYNGKLYQKNTPEKSVAGNDQKDPSRDSTNWTLMNNTSNSGDGSSNNTNYVDLTSNQLINGTKTFSDPKKERNSTNLNALDLITFQEAKNNFLSIDGKANDSKLLNGSKASDSGGNVGQQVIVMTGLDGKISDSFLNAPIIGEEKIISVNPSKADGINIFATIQEAFDSVSKMIRKAPITIKVEDNTYSNSDSDAPVLNLTKIYDCSNIQLIGNISQPENCIIKINQAQSGIYFTGKGLYINGFKIVQTGSDKGESVGIKVEYGASLILGKAIVIDNCKYGAYVRDGSYLYGEYLQANNCDYGFYVQSSVAMLDNSKSQSTKNSFIAENNATIYANNATANKGSILTNDTIGFQCSYNSVIRAKGTSTGFEGIDKPYNDMESNKPNETNSIIEYT